MSEGLLSGMQQQGQANMLPTPSSRTLIGKLCEAGAAIGWIEKGGYNEFHKYKYATEADIVSALRGELFKRKVFIFPHVTRHERVPIEVETMKWSDAEKMKVPSIRKTALTEIDIEWTFVDGESGERWTVMVPGVGEDSVDKGLYKAFTGSEKYLLMKSFLLPTGDDPERDSKDEEDTARRAGTAAAQDVAKQKLKEASKSKDPKIAAMAEEGLQKLDNKAVPAIFYVWHNPSQTAEVIKSDIVREHWKTFKAFWNGGTESVVLKAQELEDMKFYFEKKGILFKQVEAAA
jgi:ERF superfamily